MKKRNNTSINSAQANQDLNKSAENDSFCAKRFKNLLVKSFYRFEFLHFFTPFYWKVIWNSFEL